jgi:hypothetical protein
MCPTLLRMPALPARRRRLRLLPLLRLLLLLLLPPRPAEGVGACDDRYGVAAGTYRPLADWSLTEVTQWLGLTLGLARHEDLFSNNGINGAMLRHWWVTARGADNGSSWQASMHETLYHLGGYKRGVVAAPERELIAQAVAELFSLDRLRTQGGGGGAVRATTPEAARLATRALRSNVSCATVCHAAPSFYPHVFGVGKVRCGRACQPNFEVVWAPFVLDRAVGHYQPGFVNTTLASNASSCFACLDRPSVHSLPGAVPSTGGMVACRWCEPRPGECACRGARRRAFRS